MKAIAGAILMLAASIHAVAFAIAVPKTEAVTIMIAGFICFLLGLYFLFATDKTNPK